MTAPRAKRKPGKSRRIPDLSGRAFANVDAGPAPPHWTAYLDRAADQFKELKRFSFGLLGLKEGNAVLEVGCGTGDDVRELAAMLGPTGLAIGIDSSRALITEARRRSENSRLEVEFLIGDAERLDLGSECFDACRADRMLQHVADPARALKEMVRVANPGGTIQAIDRDWELVAVDAADRATTRAIVNRICDGIANGWIGRRLPALFRDCGIVEVRTDAMPVAVRDYKTANTMLDLEIVAKKAADEGAVTGAATAGWLKDLKQRHKQGRFFACWVMFVVTGRKPG
jgi:SAM-dependent methyltransferase